MSLKGLAAKEVLYQLSNQELNDISEECSRIQYNRSQMSKEYLRTKICEICEKHMGAWNELFGDFSVYIKDSLLYFDFPDLILESEHNYKYKFSLRESKDSFTIYRNVICSCISLHCWNRDNCSDEFNNATQPISVIKKDNLSQFRMWNYN
jgi:hypothetical protein